MSCAISSVDDLSALLLEQKAAFNAQGAVPAALRRARIQRVIDMLVAHHQALAQAMDADFGGRPQGFSLMNDVLGSLGSLKHARDHLEGWMQDEPRPVFSPYDQLGAEAWVMYQPKGTVGILGTWNAPLYTLLSPLGSALAAGNRAILKPSEVVPRTAALVAQLITEWFDPLEVGVVTGGVELAQAFSAQPFDHLVFTGSTAVAKSVMRNAAQNLVPVTLELGGKSPVIVARSADLATAAFRIALSKTTNSGQVCINPDVVYVPREQLENFIDAFASAYRTFIPEVSDNPDVVAVVNPQHLARVETLVTQAEQAGARVLSVPYAQPVDAQNRRRPLQLVIDPAPDSLIMHEEIFGPAMVLLPFDEVDQVIAQINDRPRPLALYYFGNDAEEQRHVLEHTLSGGVTLNDVMMHAALHDAPFGGIGGSGMGHYHGREGFLEFSHMRTVLRAPEHDPRGEWGLLPPYSEHFLAAMVAQITPD
ncbi:coniferyl aldehyde dehydrogenase [Pseudomonas sp. V1]|uniref:coniferyl aldehyde dehydrogenase n=1 Tax=Pseudomonas arcuscaelestis TaxID=2710591 RepID=UPI00193EF973|nr:coniferyl aldehyde dehydrogenase [Pseudomonas arcuscaelestis]MBM3103891.1 coniferyl aldehyde dehydrogenase [Pseudomonas arcuscaelestis]